ncbi:hypothetical protein Cgig2_030400 [Carnegiea gigantea]|uniref:Cullin family profile domain-containing protein n=1 Tax=Carnegiea gigantea TaxID=171969 RepID=A0A9Q1KL04_9CARY|nr:hypothetical protein Cgig2_030400 [Carnegiea gigantea]
MVTDGEIIRERFCYGGFMVEKMNDRKVIELEQGWDFMETGITKLKRILEGLPEPPFNSEDYMMLYTTIYNMCTQKPPHDYSQQLYDNYKQAFVDYINSTVLPSLREKHDEFMLRELVKRWSNHKVMVRWLSRFFHYLDRYFIARRSLPSLNEVGLTCFRDLVYQEISGKAKDAVIALIDVEREGGQIDRALLKNVLDIYVEIGMGQMDYYEKDFETHMLDDTAAYYSRKASSWILEDSCPEYMLKSEECLRKEKDRVAHYLHSSSEQKLLEKVQNELLLVYENQLLEKENSGCRALLKDDKVEDLSRMYRLYSKVTKGLEPIGNIFKQHITDEGTALVQQAEDAAMSKAENTGGSHEQARSLSMLLLCLNYSGMLVDFIYLFLPHQIFVRKVIELHDKFMAYVTDCFNSHTIFHKALKEAFEIFLNKGVAGSSSAELLATFCDNILKKGGSERLSDEAIEDSLEKVVKLLAYVSDKDLFAEFYRLVFVSFSKCLVTDLTLARENQTNFEEYLAQNPDITPGLDLTVTVLTTGFWPSYKSSDLNLPDEMVCLAQLNLADEDLVRVLQSLSCAKYKILIKEPSSRTVSPSDYFSFNAGFTDRMRRIRIPLPPMDERKKVVEDVDKDRRYAIDASIVRIMKSRKVLGYQQLITECVEQLSRMFKPDFKAIKKRIEDLITRDYIERDKENAQLFRYLA